MNPSVSLIISTYNWPEALNLCLKSVASQTIMPEEVIIADDGSGLATKHLIDNFQAQMGVPLIHVWHEDIGFRKSLILNKAIGAASRQYIIQVDGDVVLDKNFIKDHLSVAEEKVFVCGTRAHLKKAVLPVVFKQERTKFGFYSKGIKNRFNALRIPSLAWIFTMKRNSARKVRGCNIAFWKKDFVIVNGYNNDMKGWGAEDIELAARFVNQGVMKKGLKFKAIQYHITHDFCSRRQHSLQLRWFEDTLKNKVQRCTNGFHEIQVAVQ